MAKVEKTKQPPTGKRGGAPTTYSEELAELIIDALWSGKTMTQIERDDPRIRRRTVSDWKTNNPEFGKRYAEAMIGGAYAIVDETRDIVDNTAEPADSRKLRAWQRFEEAKRKAPQVFGDRVTHAGDPENPIMGMTDAQVDARLAVLLAKREAAA